MGATSYKPVCVLSSVYLKVSTTYRFNIEILSKLLVCKDQCILEQKME